VEQAHRFRSELEHADQCGTQCHRRKWGGAAPYSHSARHGFRFVGAVRGERETVRKLAAIFAADVEG
jgi:hypothetical protein